MKWFLFTVTLSYVAFVQSGEEKVRTMLYESTTKGESVKTSWEMEKKEGKIQVKGVKKNKVTHLTFNPDFSFFGFEEKEGQEDFLSIEKVGPCLIIKSHKKGKDKILSHKVGSKPWIQEFTFAFQKFIQGKAKSYEFYIVYPKDLSLQEMVITKEMVEELEIGQKKHLAQKAKITLTGFKKQFWKAEAWFDKDTGLLLQYRANEGPRTPYTNIQMLEGS